MTGEELCLKLFSVNGSGVSTGSYDGLSRAYSTVTDLARLRGLSTSVPRASTNRGYEPGWRCFRHLNHLRPGFFPIPDSHVIKLFSMKS